MNSASAAFNTWWSIYERTGSISPVQLGMTREEIGKCFGKPDDTSTRLSHQNPLLGIWMFGRVEFHFDNDGWLFLIYTEQEGGLNPRVIAKDPAN